MLDCGRIEQMTFAEIFRIGIQRFGGMAPSLDEIATYICTAYRGSRTVCHFRRDTELREWFDEHRHDGTIEQIRAASARVFDLARVPSRSVVGRYLREARADDPRPPWLAPLVLA